jgi:hypothetical protein
MPRPVRLRFAARIFASTFLFAFLLAGTSRAQTIQDREGSTEIPQDQSQPLPTIQEYRTPGKIPSFGDILKNIHGSYAVSFMGPRLTGDTDETYNIYIPDKAPLQLYHTMKIGYQVSPDLQIGVNEAIVNNIVGGVQGFDHDNNGNPVTPASYGKTFDWYDPNIYFNFPNLIKVPGWYVFTSASFSLSVTQDSLNIKRITQFIIQQSWTRAPTNSRWSYGAHFYVNPQFYSDPMPDGYTTREDFSFSFGPMVNYHVSDLFMLSSSATFDVEHDSPDPNGTLHLSEGLPDYIQFKATLFPNIYPMWMSISGYFQSLIWNPSWDTAIVGASFSIGF